MLLIGDIHLQAKYTDEIISSLREFVSRHDNEEHIVFVGDYVYHFSYHRKSLLALFAFFVELYQQGKHVYVLAGNHDWLGEHFVFAEGQYAIDALNSLKSDQQGSLHFITKPWLTQIEDQDIYFLPFLLDSQNLESEGEEVSVNDEPLLNIIRETAKGLMKSQDKYEKFSGLLNQHLSQVTQNFTQENPEKMLTVIHHYYIADVKFPGQKGRFRFKDIALHSKWCELENVQLISGHIHQGFSYHKYLCLGSIWSTSPLESNQCKYLWQWDTNNNTMIAHEIQINPYIRLEYLEENKVALGEQELKEHWDTVAQAIQETYTSYKHWLISFRQQEKLAIENASLHVVVPSVNYDKLHDYVDPQIENSFKQLKLNKKRNTVSNLLAQLETSSKDFSGGWHDRKAILQEYLEKKFPEELGEYTKELQSLGLA